MVHYFYRSRHYLDANFCQSGDKSANVCYDCDSESSPDCVKNVNPSMKKQCDTTATGCYLIRNFRPDETGMVQLNYSIFKQITFDLNT